MTSTLKAVALAAGLSLIGTAALACGPDGCGKDKDGKMECCCDKMGQGHGQDTAKPDAQKPEASKPAAPQGGEHRDHKH